MITTDALVTGVTLKLDKFFINLSLAMTTILALKILAMLNKDVYTNQP